MEKFTCGICFEIYDRTQHLPKCLECGHTLCSMCLDKLIHQESDSLCSFCNATITKNGSSPTNFALLTLQDQLKKQASFKERFSEEFLKFAEEKADIAEKQKSIDSFTQNCDELVTMLNDINDDISLKLHLEEAAEKGNVVSKKLESLSMPSKTWLKLNDFKNSKDFMLQLRDKAKLGPVFAAHSIDEQELLGNVTFHGTKCYVHSISLSEEEIDLSCNITFVSFQDLKLCWVDSDFGSFLQISTSGGQEVILEIQLERNGFVNRFVKLCTGELGSSYKGVPCTSETYTMLNANGYMSKGKLTTEVVNCPRYRDIPTSVQVNDYCLKFYTQGNFRIMKAPEPVPSGVIGTFVNVPNVEKLISQSGKPKILDCGVVFDFALIN